MPIQQILMILATILTIIATAIYIYFKLKFSYWFKRNIPYLEPEFPFGNTKTLILQQQNFGDCFKTIHEKVKIKTRYFGGFYTVFKPILLVLDPEYIKLILTKDFHHFHDRQFFVNKEVDPLFAHLVTLRGQEWKNMRTKLTPTFTSGKMKMMFHIMLECSKNLTSVLDEDIKEKRMIDTKEMFARISTDIIGSCAFGLDCNCLNNPDAEFRRYGKKIFQFGIRENIHAVLAGTFPNILKWLKIPQINPEVQNFFINALKETVEHRENNNIKRNDFLDLLIRLKNNESVLDENMADDKGDGKGITFNQLAAQAFVFFAAGFETTSSTLNFGLFELAINNDIQEKIRQEILKVLKKYNEEITYAAIMEMKYMDKVINEILRKYPPLPFLGRECTEDYKFPNHDFTIRKGEEVFISTLGLHMDPEHFPNPVKFDPERFNEKEKAKRHPYVYLPFGDGPRICIGMRFALMQIKIILTILLKNYKFTLDPKTITPVSFDSKSFFMSPKNPFYLRAERITS